MKKKIMMIFTTLFIIFSFIITPSAKSLNVNILSDDILNTKEFEKEREESLIEEYGENYRKILKDNYKSSKNAEKIKNMFAKTRTLGKSFDENINYPDYIGGLYINDNNELVIQIVKDNIPTTQSKKAVFNEVMSVDENAIIEYVNYSQNELDNINEIITEHFLANELPDNVVSYYIDTINNIIVVELENYNEQEIEKFKKVVDSKLITFKEGIRSIYTGSMNAGSPIDIEGNGCSMGYRARVGSSGTGFVTAGHCTRNNSTGKLYTNITYGEVKNRQIGGNMDAAYIKTNSSYTPTNNWYAKPPYTVPSGTLSTAVKTSFTVGEKVGRIGTTSGTQTGTITNINKSVNINFNGTSEKYTKLVATNVRQLPGDSGGIVYYSYIDYSGQFGDMHDTAGIGTIAENDQMIFSRADLINSKFGISRY